MHFSDATSPRLSQMLHELRELPCARVVRPRCSTIARSRTCPSCQGKRRAVAARHPRAWPTPEAGLRNDKVWRQRGTRVQRRSSGGGLPELRLGRRRDAWHLAWPGPLDGAMEERGEDVDDRCSQQRARDADGHCDAGPKWAGWRGGGERGGGEGGVGSATDSTSEACAFACTSPRGAETGGRYSLGTPSDYER